MVSARLRRYRIAYFFTMCSAAYWIGAQTFPDSYRRMLASAAAEAPTPPAGQGQGQLQFATWMLKASQCMMTFIFTSSIAVLWDLLSPQHNWTISIVPLCAAYALAVVRMFIVLPAAANGSAALHWVLLLVYLGDVLRCPALLNFCFRFLATASFDIDV